MNIFEKIKRFFSKAEEDQIMKKEENIIENNVNDSTKIVPVEITKETIFGNIQNLNIDKIVVLLDPGHTCYTSGKHSPDGLLYEWKYNRIIVKQIEEALDELGIEHWNSHPEDGWVDNKHNTDNKDLQLRVQRINNKYTDVKKQGKTAVLLSIHVNAAGNGLWMNATGWSAWTTKGQNNSDKLANCLYEAADEILKPINKKVRTDLSDNDKDYEANFYIIKNVNCVAVLTENFFMDNKKDILWLLTEEAQKYITNIHIYGIKKYIEKYIQ